MKKHTMEKETKSKQVPESDLSKVLKIFPGLDKEVISKTVADYGCGHGMVSSDLAARAKLVYAVDIRPEKFSAPKRQNIIIGNPEIIPEKSIDALISIDGFEHYTKPGETLAHWRRLLLPHAKVYMSFGPPWYHPYGAHTDFFTRLPWIHLWCPERIVLAWRSRYRNDGAKVFEEVEGGLCRMTLTKCDKMLSEAGFKTIYSRNMPIMGIQWPLHSRIGSEFWTGRVDRILCLD